jgi:lysozyme
MLDADGHGIDLWAEFDSDEIVRRAKVWLSLVEQRTRKKPIIYSNYHWWTERIGARDDFNDYNFWIADYASASQNSETPKVPPNLKWAFWQFTDQGRASPGLNGRVDTSIFNGSREEFLRRFAPRN